MGCRFSRLLRRARRRRALINPTSYEITQARPMSWSLASPGLSRVIESRIAAGSETKQAPEGSKWALLLRRLARRIEAGRIIPSDHDSGFPHAFRRNEIVERSGVGQRESDATVGDGRTEAWMV